MSLRGTTGIARLAGSVAIKEVRGKESRQEMCGSSVMAPRLARRNGVSGEWRGNGLEGAEHTRVKLLVEKRSRAEGAGFAETEVAGFGEGRSGFKGEFLVESADGRGMGGLSGRRNEGSSSKHEVL